MRKLALVCALLAAWMPVFLGSAQVSRATIDKAGLSTVFVETDRGSGSGFLFSSDGYILTCNHVIDKATSIQVYAPDGRKFVGRVVQAAPEIDTAVLKIDATVQNYLSLGDSAGASYGDAVAAIGYPQRVFTVTTGTVSAFPSLGEMKIMQVTAPINPGNSGGPLVRYSGEVIGIIFAAADADEYLRQYGFVPQAMNYAVPINLVKERFGLASEDWRLTIASTLVFQDDFSQSKGWWSGAAGDSLFSGTLSDLVFGQSYHAILWHDNWLYWVTFPLSSFPANFVLDLDARSVSACPDREEGYGLVFRLKGGAYYAWQVVTDGHFVVRRHSDDDSWHVLQSDTYLDAVKTQREVNHLRLVVDGSRFVFEINGVQVAIVEDGTLTEGDIALVVSSAVGPSAYTHAAFDNIRLYALP